MAVGVFVWNLMRLPHVFPKLNFSIDYWRLSEPARAAEPAAERVASS